MISDERAAELSRMYKEEYGKELSIDEAKEMGRRLVELYRVLLQRLPSERHQGEDSVPPSSRE